MFLCYSWFIEIDYSSPTMKKIILASILSVLASTTATAKSTCDNVLDIAMTVMDARQAGLDAPIMIKSANEMSKGKDMVLAMTKDAFTYSRYDSESTQDAVTEEFAYKHYLNCLKRTGQ